MSRFEDVTENVIELFDNVRREFYPELRNAKIKIIFDNKKRKSGGKLVIGRMTKTNDLIRHLSDDEDYIMYLDKVAFENVDEKDKIRIIKHELYHCDIDMESSTNPYKIRDHEISTFYDEIEDNKDDPRWVERIITVMESVYERDN